MAALITAFSPVKEEHRCLPFPTYRMRHLELRDSWEAFLFISRMTCLFFSFDSASFCIKAFRIYASLFLLVIDSGKMLPALYLLDLLLGYSLGFLTRAYR